MLGLAPLGGAGAGGGGGGHVWLGVFAATELAEPAAVATSANSVKYTCIIKRMSTQKNK